MIQPKLNHPDRWSTCNLLHRQKGHRISVGISCLLRHSQRERKGLCSWSKSLYTWLNGCWMENAKQWWGRVQSPGLFHWVLLLSDSTFSLSATSGTQIFFFFFFFFQYPSSRQWRIVSLLQSSHWLSHCLGRSGFRRRRRVEMNSWFPMREHTL